MTQKPLFPDSTLYSARQSTELWLRLIRDRRWSRAQKHRLIDYFGSTNKLYAASAVELEQVAGKPRKKLLAKTIQNDIAADLVWLEQDHHFLLTINDDGYPQLLREINDPPLAIFAKGNLELLSLPSVAIVGSRRPSPLGKAACVEIAQGLASMGVCIVSGMALGIDGNAHQAALEQSGSTIAVLGCGVDVIYPSRNRNLYHQVGREGLILSEYPLGYPATQYTFPDRNRIVSGLCAGTVVVEAAERSGTIITARLTMEQNRELMVVPGPALSGQYSGSHRLIRDGAALVCNTADVIAEMSSHFDQYLKSQQCNAMKHLDESKREELPEGQSKILKYLDYVGVSLDDLVVRSGLDVGSVSALLVELELSSMVAMTPEGSYIRTA